MRFTISRHERVKGLGPGPRCFVLCCQVNGSVGWLLEVHCHLGLCLKATAVLGDLSLRGELINEGLSLSLLLLMARWCLRPFE